MGITYSGLAFSSNSGDNTSFVIRDMASGATVSGPTVHVVTPEYDRGPILAQWPVPVAAGDTPESLRDRVLAAEHRLLPAVVLAAARAGGRAVRLVPASEFPFAVSEA